jgi:hypothetical protein
MTDDNLPPFMLPPGEEPKSNVVAFRNTRAITSDVTLARNKKLQEYGIDTELILNDAARIYKKLMDGSETLRDHMGEKVEVPLSRERIQSLNIAQTMCFKLLNKTMPDIKQVVLQDETGEETIFNFEMVLTDDG